MNLPKKIKVGPYTYTIKRFKHKETDYRGKHSSFDQTIEISSDTQDDCQAETLLHELLHACWWVSQMHKKEKEETIVKNLSMQLMSVFKNNPKLRDVFFV